MPTDDEQIRDLVQRWNDASRVGDLDTLLGLMTDDVVFLVSGQPPMDKAKFAEISRMSPGAPRPTIDADTRIDEIRVSGDTAYMRCWISVKVTPPGGSEIRRAGFTLTVLQRDAGQWRIARDANLLMPA